MTYVTDKKTKRVRKLRPDTKYDPKFTDELLSGIRYKKKLSIVQLCRKWRITRKTYWLWRQNYQEFSDAAELAELDYASYFMELNHDVCEGKKKGNAQLIALNLGHLEQVNMTTRIDVSKKEESISTININIIPSQTKSLEQQETRVIEHEVRNNTVPLKVISNDESD